MKPTTHSVIYMRLDACVSFLYVFEFRESVSVRMGLIRNELKATKFITMNDNMLLRFIALSVFESPFSCKIAMKH